LAISKEKKREIVADYEQRMSDSQALILTDYRGLSVADLTRLRRQLRDSDGRFQIVKNTLFERALQAAGLAVPVEQLEGPIAIGYCLAEVPPVAKVLVDFAQKTNALQIKGAVLGASFLDTEGVRSLAALPPREILLGQLVGAIQGPMRSLVSTLNAPMRDLAQVLRARSEQGADGERSVEAAA